MEIAIAVVLVAIVAFVIWTNVARPDLADLDREIKAAEKLQTESRSMFEPMARPEPLSRGAVDRESIDDPLANWKRTTPREPSRPRGAARQKAARASKPPPLKGRKLDEVRFDYINAEGEYSSRRLVVQVIGENYFEGFDPDKLETRTFRYDRVVGDIVSELTGESIVPGAWSPAKQ